MCGGLLPHEPRSILCADPVDMPVGTRRLPMKSLVAFPGMGIFRRLLRDPAAVVSLTLAATALIAGCAAAPTQSESMIDSNADFSAYRTFSWHWLAGADDSDEPMSLVDANIRAAIATELQRKGYVEAPAGSVGDFSVDYEAARVEKVKNNPFRIGIGVGSYGSSGGASVSAGSPSVKNVSEGSLVIHIIDTASNSEVWRSRVSRELGKGNIKPEVVESVVAEVFTDFPARSAAP